MVRRRSDDLHERLQNLSVQDKGKAIVLAAARMGKSQRDLVRILTKIVPITTTEQARQSAVVWAPLLDLTLERFVELAGDVLKERA